MQFEAADDMQPEEIAELEQVIPCFFLLCEYARMSQFMFAWPGRSGKPIAFE